MKDYIKTLKIGLISILILTLVGFPEILFALDWTQSQTRKESRKQRKLDSQNTTTKQITDENKISNLEWSKLWETKIITDEFRKIRQEILRKKDAGEITTEQARILLTQERNKLEDKIIKTSTTFELWDVNIQDNNQIIKPLEQNTPRINNLSYNPDFQKRKTEAFKKRKWENSLLKNKKEDERKEQMIILRKWFEKYKTEILIKVKNWELSHKEAREILTKYREEKIINQRLTFKQERDAEKKQQLIRINTIITEKLTDKLSKYDSYTVNQQIEIYNKILSNINLKLESDNINWKNIVLLNLIKVIVTDKKNTLS